MNKLLKITKALSDKSRLRAFMVLCSYDELCLCRITEMLGLAPATVSRHMTALQNAGLIKATKNGRWVNYKIADDIDQKFLDWLKTSLANDKTILSDNDKMMKILKSAEEKNCEN